MSLVQLSRNLSRSNLRSIHSCALSFYALVTLPCYLTIALTSRSFCAHTVAPSHHYLSPFLTCNSQSKYQSLTQYLLPHATQLSYSLVQTLLLSLSLRMW